MNTRPGFGGAFNPANITTRQAGTYRRYGHFGLVNGTCTCTNGDSGEAIYLEMSNQVQQLSARDRNRLALALLS